MPLDIELVPVLYMPHDGIADVWLRKNIKTEIRNENGEEYEVQTADEVFFQIDSAATSEQNIIDNFDGTKYSINRLALACDLSTKQVYKILRRHFDKQKKKNS